MFFKETEKGNLLQIPFFTIGTFIKYYKISQLIHTQIIAN